jgi:hypothetical protein
MKKVLLLIILVTSIICTACGMKTVKLYGWEPEGPDRSIRVTLYSCDRGSSF